MATVLLLPEMCDEYMLQLRIYFTEATFWKYKYCPLKTDIIYYYSLYMLHLNNVVKFAKRCCYNNAHLRKLMFCEGTHALVVLVMWKKKSIGMMLLHFPSGYTE